jgi:hypothetical protein
MEEFLAYKFSASRHSNFPQYFIRPFAEQFLRERNTDSFGFVWGAVDCSPDDFFPVNTSNYRIQKKFPRLNSSKRPYRNLAASFEKPEQSALTVGCLPGRGMVQRLHGGNKEGVIGPDFDGKGSLANCGENQCWGQNFRDDIRPSKSSNARFSEQHAVPL